MLHPFSIGLDSIVDTDPAALAGMLVYVRTMDIMDLSGNVLETPPSSDSDRLFNDEVWRLGTLAIWQTSSESLSKTALSSYRALLCACLFFICSIQS